MSFTMASLIIHEAIESKKTPLILTYIKNKKGKPCQMDLPFIMKLPAANGRGITNA